VPPELLLGPPLDDGATGGGDGGVGFGGVGFGAARLAT